jgi:hypothetical protein
MSELDKSRGWFPLLCCLFGFEGAVHFVNYEILELEAIWNFRKFRKNITSLGKK